MELAVQEISCFRILPTVAQLHTAVPKPGRFGTPPLSQRGSFAMVFIETIIRNLLSREPPRLDGWLVVGSDTIGIHILP